MLPPPSATLDELTQRLHQANEHFHASRQEWEKWLAADEYRHMERIAAAREQLAAAEREVEAIEEQIKTLLERGSDRPA